MTATTLRVLGLCPLAVMASSLATGAVLGTTTLLVWSIAVLLLSTDWFPQEPAIRHPAILLVAAALTTIIQLLCKAFLFEFYAVNGVSLTLAITLGATTSALAIASGPSLRVALMQSSRHGALMALVLLAVGGLRQLSGPGFAPAPAGAFFSLALLIAVRTAVTGRLRDR